jgi:hypothetical protein
VTRTKNLQLDDVADGVVVVGAVAPDARVHVLVNVDVGAVRGRADARVAADPCRPQLQPEFFEHRVQRVHCQPHTEKNGMIKGLSDYNRMLKNEKNSKEKD